MSIKKVIAIFYISTAIFAQNSTCMLVEKSFVPVVFFEKTSSDVGMRFDAMLTTIAARLTENPELRVEIRGYYHPAGDDGADGEMLAMMRAKAVRDRITKFAPEISSRVIAQPTTDAKQLFRGQHGSLDAAIQRENMRAEISLVPIAQKHSSAFENDVYRLERVLSDNPAALYLCAKPQAKAFSKLPPFVANKLFATQIDTAIIAASSATVFSNFEVNCSKCELIENNKQVFDNFGLRARQRFPYFEYYEPQIVRSAAGEMKSFATGKPEKCTTSTDASFRFVTAHYMLDATKPPSDMPTIIKRAQLARFIIAVVEKSAHSGSILFTGHTDSLADDEKMRQMSLFWAELEMQEFLTACAAELGEKSIDDAKKFFVSHKISISAEGAKCTQPAGNFTTPEGRVGSRRVELLFAVTAK